MLGRDLQEVDPAMHQSLIWILENPGTEALSMTFSVDYDRFGELVTHELKPNGADIEVRMTAHTYDQSEIWQVNESNKQEFVRLMVEWRLSRGVERQLVAIVQGLAACTLC